MLSTTAGHRFICPLLAVGLVVGVFAGPAAAGPPTLGGAPDVVARVDSPGHGDDEAYDVAVDPVTGTAVVAGRLSRGVHVDRGVVAYRADGTQLWRSTKVGDRSTGARVAIDATRQVVYVAGAQGYGDPQYFLTRLHVTAYDLVDGRVRWQWYAPERGGDGVSAMVVDEARGRLVIGGTVSTAAATTVLTADGALLWTSTYGDLVRCAVPDLTVDTPTGEVTTVVNCVDLEADGVRLIRYTPEGAQRWIREAGPYGLVRGVGVESDPASGTTYLALSFAATTVLTAYRSDGSRWWGRFFRYGTDSVEYIKGLLLVLGRGLYLAGATFHVDGQGLWTAGFTQRGSLLWKADIPVPGNSMSLFDTAVDPVGGRLYLAAATSLPAEPGAADYVLAGFDLAGAGLGLSTYDGPGTGGSISRTALRRTPNGERCG